MITIVPAGPRTADIYTAAIPLAGRAALQAERAEAAGWDGISLTDSQNLIGDPFVAAALGAKATDGLKFMTGVSNPATRLPAALATLAATVQEESQGRFALGLGRGDTALFHLGRKPMPVADFIARTTEVHTYLNKGTVDQRGFPSRLRWLDMAQQAPVPISIAASGPKVIAFAARTVERVTLAVGADPERIAWGLDLARSAARDAGRPEGSVSYGAYLNIGCHPDTATACEMIRGTIAAFAHFSSMPGSTGEGVPDRDREMVAEVGRRYDSRQHLFASAEHSSGLSHEFIARFGIAGDVGDCATRVHELLAMGLDHVIVAGPSMDADRDHAKIHHRLMTEELLPAIHE